MNENPGSSAHTGWDWVPLSGHEPLDRSIKDPAAHQWLQTTRESKHNSISTAPFPEKSPCLHGSIVIYPNPHMPQEYRLLRYFVSNDDLFTIGLAEFLHIKAERNSFNERVAACASPIEALLYIVNHVIEHYFEWMDRFERQLTEAKGFMQLTNGGHLFRYIMDLRYNLLHWNAQVIPFKEIRLAAEEVFHETIKESHHFSVLILRLKRVQMLQDEYKAEIDSLLKLDEATINYRGNDIMKTLTVFTALLTPLTALGAIWGMNFKRMPELEWGWGYLAALFIMLSLMAGIYLYLRKQGWTGNILELDRKRKP
jgi:magnesium transporter